MFTVYENKTKLPFFKYHKILFVIIYPTDYLCGVAMVAMFSIQ